MTVFLPGHRTYRSYAKINWYLDVLDRRPDGFTNIETIFQTVDLYDELTFAPADAGVAFTCNRPDLSDPRGNLVCRAAELLQRHAGITRGAAIHLDKRIPVAAGLAGGSGNAAATLVALNELWSLNAGPADLEALAAALGSDVPYCLRGGTVAATGRGEVMETLPPAGRHWVLLVHPPLAISAGHAYGHPRLTRNLETPVDGRTPAFRDAIKELHAGRLSGIIFNRMESGVLCDHPELSEIKDRLRGAGCLTSAMSGSGPTVFGLCPTEVSARAAGALFADYPVSMVQTIDHGLARIT